MISAPAFGTSSTSGGSIATARGMFEFFLKQRVEATHVGGRWRRGLPEHVVTRRNDTSYAAYRRRRGACLDRKPESIVDRLGPIQPREWHQHADGGRQQGRDGQDWKRSPAAGQQARQISANPEPRS